MSAALNPEDRLQELLSSKATEGLSHSEDQELERLLSESEMSDEPERFEISAAAFDMASNGDEILELPSELRDKLLLKAGEFFGNPDLSSRAGSTLTQSLSDDVPSVAYADKSGRADQSGVDRPSRAKTSSSSGRFRELLAWATAAASLTFGLWIWNTRPSDPDLVKLGTSLIEEVTSAEDKVSANWNSVGIGVDFKKVTGGVVWSDKTQGGYMIFDNLPKNDPTKEQYQLWIFDTDVNQEIPVDGGVFDIDGEGVKIPFRASHPVDHGVQFAVTIERPGGVQRSDRSRVPVLATIDFDDESSSMDEQPPSSADSLSPSPAL